MSNALFLFTQYTNTLWFFFPFFLSFLRKMNLDHKCNRHGNHQRSKVPRFGLGAQLGRTHLVLFKQHRAAELGVWYYLGETFQGAGRGSFYQVNEYQWPLILSIKIGFCLWCPWSGFFLLFFSLPVRLSLYHDVLLLILLWVALCPSSLALY